MANSGKRPVRRRVSTPPSEGSLFRQLVSKFGTLVEAHNGVVDDLEVTDGNVAALQELVEELQQRPTVTPEEIESLTGELDAMEIKALK